MVGQIDPINLLRVKARYSEIKQYPLCLGNISKDEKSELNGYGYDFSVDHNVCDVSDILSICKYLIKKQTMKQCFLTEQDLNCIYLYFSNDAFQSYYDLFQVN